MPEEVKTVVQCDFDGTITVEDVSYKMLEAYADSSWKELRRRYHNGAISVGRFNTEAFALVKVGKEALLEVAHNTMAMRPGLTELVDCCRRKDFRFVVISNGLDFYIEDILRINNLDDIEVHAAETRFYPGKLIARYVTPSGVEIENGLKEAYADRFLSEGCRVIYIGNGVSDIAAAVKCHHIFATGELLDYCKKHLELSYTQLTDFYGVARVLKESF